MPRFYLNNEICLNSTFKLPENIVRHIHVLRLNLNDKIILFNGNGIDFVARINDISKRHADCTVLSSHIVDNESTLNITLTQAISSGERMDFTLQKSVELGVIRIQPIISERCMVRLSGERADKRVQRWQEIVISACEQSGRAVVPEVLPILSLREYLANLSTQEIHLLMSLNRANTLHDLSPVPQNINLMIGPEGGWATNEEQAAFDAGFKSITLGKRILRTETAGLAAISAIQTLWGDF